MFETVKKKKQLTKSHWRKICNIEQARVFLLLWFFLALQEMSPVCFMPSVNVHVTDHTLLCCGFFFP